MDPHQLKLGRIVDLLPFKQLPSQSELSWLPTQVESQVPSSGTVKPQSRLPQQVEPGSPPDQVKLSWLPIQVVLGPVHRDGWTPVKTSSPG